MITDYILSNEDAMALLNVPSNSVAFYRYLAVKEVDLKANKTKVPYITEGGGASTDYTNYHYFFNEDAHGLTREKWLGENVINVLSHIYFDSLADDEKGNIAAIPIASLVVFGVILLKYLLNLDSTNLPRTPSSRLS